MKEGIAHEILLILFPSVFRSKSIQDFIPLCKGYFSIVILVHRYFVRKDYPVVSPAESVCALVYVGPFICLGIKG